MVFSRAQSKVAMATAIVGLGVVVWLSEPMLAATGDFLVIQDTLRPADIIHVISGPDDRTDYAIQLYKQGYARQILLTGGCCCLTGHENHAQHARQRAIEQGVPPEAIVVDDTDVTSTYAEVERVREVIVHSVTPIRSLIVVSDPHHMRRARWTYRRILGAGVALQMAPVPFGVSLYQRRWWSDELSRSYVRNEYVKIVYYVARYQLGIGPLSYWLASLDRE